MKRIIFLLLFLIPLSSLFANETKIVLTSKTPVPFYQVKSIFIDPAATTIVNDYDIHLKSLELVTISPAEFKIENGNYIFAVSVGSYNKIVPIKAAGETIEIDIRPSSPYADYFLVGAAGALVGTLFTSEFVTRDAEQSVLRDPWFYATASLGAASCAGVALWLSSIPRVTVKLLK